MSQLLAARAAREIRAELQRLECTEDLNPRVCEGMLQMAKALGLVTDTGLKYWHATLANTVERRRQHLLNLRHQRILAEIRA